MTRASRVLKVLVISLVVAAISRGGAAPAATLPVVTAQSVIEKALCNPTSIATGADGSLYVADQLNKKVFKFNASGDIAQTIVFKATPEGIALAADGRLLVSHRESVAIYSATGAEIGKLGTGVGQFKVATGITVDDTGQIYVVDSKDACVQVFKSDGSFVKRFGVAGKLDGQFQYPVAIAFEKTTKQLAVVDSLNDRVQFYDLSGTFVRSIGANGSGPLKFMHPRGIAFEYGANGDTRMYLSDLMLRKIQVIDPAGTGSFLAYLNDSKDGRTLPSSLAFDQTSQSLYVLNGMGGVSVFRITDGAVVVAVSSTKSNATSVSSNAQPPSPTAALVTETPVAPYQLSTIADGSTVTGNLLDVSGKAVGVTAVTVNGLKLAVINNQFSTAVPLNAGLNEVVVTVTDASGTTWTETRKVTLDSGAPVLNVAAADVLATSGNLLKLQGTTDRTAIVYVNNIPAELNKLEWTSTVALNKGLNTIDIQAVDLNGLAANQKRTVYYNPTAPELTINTPAEDLITTAKSLTIKGVAAAGTTTITADVNGTSKQVPVVAGQFKVPVAFKQEGTYTVTLTAGDGSEANTSTVSRTVVYRKAK